MSEFITAFFIKKVRDWFDGKFRGGYVFKIGFGKIRCRCSRIRTFLGRVFFGGRRRGLFFGFRIRALRKV